MPRGISLVVCFFALSSVRAMGAVNCEHFKGTFFNSWKPDAQIN